MDRWHDSLKSAYVLILAKHNIAVTEKTDWFELLDSLYLKTNNEELMEIFHDLLKVNMGYKKGD